MTGAAQLRFYASLNDFLAPGHRQRQLDYRVARRASVKDVIEALGVPHTEIGLILVDGTAVGFAHLVTAGERISVYPVFTTLAPDGASLLRPPPALPPRFVADTHLGTLARYLRLLGFDTRYRNDHDDATLAAIAAGEARILLTRDRGLLKRRAVTHACFLRADRPRDQLHEVAVRFPLGAWMDPLSRCARCNGVLRAVDKAAIAHRLAPKTRRYYRRFRECDGCGQLYWAGSHVRHLEALVAEVRDGADGNAPPGKGPTAHTPPG